MPLHKRTRLVGTSNLSFCFGVCRVNIRVSLFCDISCVVVNCNLILTRYYDRTYSVQSLVHAGYLIIGDPRVVTRPITPEVLSLNVLSSSHFYP